MKKQNWLKKLLKIKQKPRMGKNYAVLLKDKVEPKEIK
jgi:hypothetical protein